MPLLWSNFLLLSVQFADKDEMACAIALQKFSQILIRTAEDRGTNKWGRGLLNVIGLSKQDSMSIGFRFLCRALGGKSILFCTSTLASKKNWSP